MQFLDRIKRFMSQDIWRKDVERSPFLSPFIKVLRFIYVVVREFYRGELNLRAMSLVYTTLLSIVPLLAVSFSVLKAFGVHNQLEPFLYRFFEPLGPRAEETVQRILGFVENVKAGILGSAGLALLIYTVISLIKKIEDTFNQIWRVKSPRSFARRFSDYMSVLLIGPVLVFSSLGLTASLMSTRFVQKLTSIEPFGTFITYLGKGVPYILICAAFTFVYIFVPNTKVKWSAALAGGVFGGILWETMGWAFASFVVTSTKYAAIYSGFAILILFFIWLYLSWLIVLTGATVSYYFQYPQMINVRPETLTMSNSFREKLGLTIMYLIGKSHYRGTHPWSVETLAQHLELPLEPVSETVAHLRRNGFVVETIDDPPGYLPARAIDQIGLGELLKAIRGGPDREEILKVSSPVEEIFRKVDEAMEETLRDTTLKDVIVDRDGV